jgi:DNA-binding GntR family transcriptional regulator
LGNSSIILHLIELLWLQYGPSMRFICSRWGDSTSDLDHHRSVTAALDRNDCPAFRAAIEADIEQGIKLILQS